MIWWIFLGYAAVIAGVYMYLVITTKPDDRDEYMKRPSVPKR